MQTLRDALILLVAIMIVATVRVSPAPEIRLSASHAAEPARAAEPALAPAPAVDAGALPAKPGGEATPEAKPLPGPCCDPTLTVKTAPKPGSRSVVNLCDA